MTKQSPQTMWMSIGPDNIAEWELLSFTLQDCVESVNNHLYPRHTQKELEALGYEFVQVTVTVKEKKWYSPVMSWLFG